MVRELIEKEVSAAIHAVEAVKDWIHPTQVMKDQAFDYPLDDLGQAIDELERQVPKAQRS
jgi:hypothetical protein